MKSLLIIFILAISELVAVEVNIPEAYLSFNISTDWKDSASDFKERFNHKEQTLFDTIKVKNLVCHYCVQHDGGILAISTAEVTKGTIEEIKAKNLSPIIEELIKTYSVPTYDDDGKRMMHGPEFHNFNGSLTFTYRLLSRINLPKETMEYLGRTNPRFETNVSDYFYIKNDRLVFVRASTQNPEQMGELDTIIRTFRTIKEHNQSE